MPLLDRFIRLLDRLVWLSARYIPFSALNTMLRTLDGSSTSLLDVGCGTGGPTHFIKRQKNYLRIGADVYAPSLKQAQGEELYDMLVLCDLRRLPFKAKVVDIVTCLQTLEHFDRQDGLRLIGEMERIARRQVVITTPVGNWKQPPSVTNPFDEHKHIWSPSDLRELGYTVRGYGFRSFAGSTGLVMRIPRLAMPLAYLGWAVVSPFAYYAPAMAGGVVCGKKLS